MLTRALRKSLPLLIAAVSVLPSTAQKEMPWIGNEPPEGFPGHVMPSGMHKISAIRGKRGMETFVQFPRRGESVMGSAYLDSASVAGMRLLAFLPDGKPLRAGLSQKARFGMISYDGSAEGYHYLYLVDTYQRDSIRYTDIAAAERLQHKCRNGHSHVKGMLGYRLFPDEVPFEVRRERYAREDFHTFVSSGDRVVLSAWFRGEPVAGARIRIITQEGWELRLTTDEEGRAEFSMAGDYYSPLSDLDDRHRSTFLVIAEYAVPGQEGEHVYRYSITDDYWPSSILYRSKVMPWMLTLAIIIAGVMILAIRRRRGSRPYRKIRFDEA